MAGKVSALRMDRRAGRALLAVALVVGALALRLSGLTIRRFWNDEVISIAFAQKQGLDLLRAAVKDVVHPPLFYAMLKIWIWIGGSGDAWMRGLPIVASMLSLIPTALLARELGLSRRARALGLALVAANGFLIHYAQELRMYSFLQLWSVTSLWLFARFLRRGNRPHPLLAAMALVNLVMVFTHYYGWLVIGLEGLLLLLAYRSRFLTFTMATIPVAACFAPWAWLVTRRAWQIGGLGQNLGRFARPGGLDALGYYGTLGGASPETTPAILWTPAVAGLGVLVATFALRPVVSGRGPSGEEAPAARSGAGFLAFFSFMPVLLTVLASHILPQSVFHPRYMIIAATPFLLLLAASAQDLRTPGLRYAAVALVAGLALVGGIGEVLFPNRVAWGEMARAMQNMEGGSSPSAGPIPVYVFGRGNAKPIRYYLALADRGRFDVRLVENAEQIDAASGWVACLDVPASRRSADFRGFWGTMDSGEIRTELQRRGYRVDVDLVSGHQTEGHLMAFRKSAEVGG